MKEIRLDKIDNQYEKLLDRFGDRIHGRSSPFTLLVDDDLTESEIEEAKQIFHGTVDFKTALQAFNNWSSLTNAQKDTILKNILKYILFKEGIL